MAALLIGAAGLTAVPAGAAEGVVRVVAPWGDDAAAGTVDAPYRTVRHGVVSLAPGDTLLLRAGTYREQLRNPPVRAGSAEARIRVASWPGERAVIQGLLWMKGASYWTLDGLAVTWDPEVNLPNEHLVKMTNGIGWRLTGSEIWGARSYAGLLIASSAQGEPADWVVDGNCIHDTHPANLANQDHLVYANTGLTAGPGRISRNLLFNATNGNGVKLGGSSATTGGAANVVVAENTIWNTAQNVLVSWQSSRNTLTRNLLGVTTVSYGNVRGYQLTGSGNVAQGNVGVGARQFLYNDPGYPGVADAGDNTFPVDPRFDDTSTCAGFRPADPVAASVGRHAPASDEPPTSAPTADGSSTTSTTAIPESTTTSSTTTSAQQAELPSTTTTTSSTTSTSTTTTTVVTTPSTTSSTTSTTSTTAPASTTTVKTKATTTTSTTSTTSTTARPRIKR